MARRPKLHRKIQQFFSKIDSSRQLEPLIGYSLKKQHQVIPGPAHFHRRTAKDVRRARLLELYDADSYFSSQLVSRLQPKSAITVHGNTFLKMMEILVTIFNVYLQSQDTISSTCPVKILSDKNCTVKPKVPRKRMSDTNMVKLVGQHYYSGKDKASKGDYSYRGEDSTNNDTCKPSRTKSIEFLTVKKRTDLDKGYNTVSSDISANSSAGELSNHKKLKIDGQNSNGTSNSCARTLVWKGSKVK